jgi:hypothetical protein
VVAERTIYVGSGNGRRQLVSQYIYMYMGPRKPAREQRRMMIEGGRIILYIYASSRKNKSRQGITIRKNKQPVSIDQSSNSHLNRTDSSHSINVRSASNMIPCFPVNNSTDMHHCDIVSSRSSPSQFTKDKLLIILPKSEPGQLQKNKPLLRNRNTGEMLMLQFISGRLISF